jgi:hypothetical protein
MCPILGDCIQSIGPIAKNDLQPLSEGLGAIDVTRAMFGARKRIEASLASGSQSKDCDPRRALEHPRSSLRYSSREFVWRFQGR